jgi:uncharacterized protein YbjT (DUF2867 family)
MSLILLTGGTGTLGRVVHQQLRAAGQPVRILSRRPHPGQDGYARGDLRIGEGIEAAVAGASTVIHCATASRGDVSAAKNLIAAAREARPHLVYISIVGVDRIPQFYYRSKLRVEQLIEDSGLPWTVLRAVQFHTLVLGLFSAQRRLPVLFAPAFSFQPIHVPEVADRLVELALADPAGRVADIGGPEVTSAAELAGAYLTATGRRRRIVNVRLPGRTFAAYRAGHHLVPTNAFGTTTFARFLSETFAN